MVGLRAERIWNGRGNIGTRIVGNGMMGMEWCLMWMTGAGREGGQAEVEVEAESEGEEMAFDAANTTSGGKFTRNIR